MRGVSTFQLEYYDFEKQDWLKEWNSADAIGQPDRLPPFVRVTLGIDDGDGERKLSTIVKLPLTAPIMEVR